MTAEDKLMTTETTQTNDEVTEDMQFALIYLEGIVGMDPTDQFAARALRGAKFMSQALDGLSNMLRMLPMETQQRIAEDMYSLVTKNRERMHLMA